MNLVTGGAGFIGSHLVSRLVSDGRPVRVLDNFATGRPEALALVLPMIDLIEGDIRDDEAVARAMRGVDTVYHLAAQISVPRSIEDPQETIDVNVTGTLKLLQAATRAGCRRLVFSSTCAVFGDAGGSATDETAIPRPLSPYAVSKLTGEQLCGVFTHNHGLETVSLRYFNVFGPGQNPGSAYAAAIPRFVSALRAGVPPVVFGDGEQTRDFVSVDDVVTANLLAADVPAAAGHVFNIGSGQATSINALVRHLQRLVDTNLPIRHEPARRGEIRHSLASTGFAGAVLGYEPAVGLLEGLERLLLLVI